ncbi:fido domain-containing protein [Armillaria nabsnona]|nr:fido domain-containing protein [Armillaria nabsnona]
MRFVLNHESVAMDLYRELPPYVRNPALDKWIAETGDKIDKQVRERLIRYRSGIDYVRSQRWVPTAAIVPFPHAYLMASQLNTLRTLWGSFKDPAKVMKQYLNYLCLQTNEQEGTVIVSRSASTILVELGFFHQMTVNKMDITGGQIRDRESAVSLLRDTHNALSMVFNLLQPNSATFNLTIDDICKIHHMLMMSSRVVAYTGVAGPFITYTNIGVTRANTKIDVMVRAPNGTNIQFCPWPEVEEELKIFCNRFNASIKSFILLSQAQSTEPWHKEIMGATNIDPFAAAAWINHVFISIHPFEDGNGRLGRILASVPLLRARLPPVCIVRDKKAQYNNILNSMRSMPRNTNDFEQLIHNMYTSTFIALKQLPVSQ